MPMPSMKVPNRLGSESRDSIILAAQEPGATTYTDALTFNAWTMRKSAARRAGEIKMLRAICPITCFI
jgi:hypothetical protein